MAEAPDNLEMIYNKQYHPFYFTKPTELEYWLWSQNIQHINREYLTMCRKYNLSENIPLSNGMTTGEFAIYLLTNNHVKRNRMSEKPHD
jgi:hypothetical protein